MFCLRLFFIFFYTMLIAVNDVVRGPITAHAAASPRRKVRLFGRRASGPWVTSLRRSART